MKIEDKNIILFDGVCNMCSALVQFVIKEDTDKKFFFVTLQSNLAKKLSLEYQFPLEKMDTFVLLKKGKVFIKSSASLELFWLLGSWWKVLYGFKIIPRPLRDYVYDFFAKNRYSWFGRKDKCLLPKSEDKARFLKSS